ncbi:MAG TPA: nuclear transport factor 2 family protein [Gemmatimonadetes bacterium]|nr:nuclear transport factor 2 family protein [Gemmatimonadota bacterium]
MRGVVLRLLGVTWACVLLVLAPTGMEVQLKVLTRSTTDRYIELTFGRDYDALLELYSPDAVFHEPTGEIFQGAIAQGPVRCAETIVAMRESSGIAGAAFLVAGSLLFDAQ